MNRRIAAHKNRKGPVRVEEHQQPARRAASSRAAEVLARVNARYASAPSYSQALAGEARAAVRAAEAATRAAAEAHAAAQSVLAGLEAATAAGSGLQMHSPQAVTEAVQAALAEPEYAAPLSAPNYAVRWAEELPRRMEEPAASAGGVQESFQVVPEGWHGAGQLDEAVEHDGVEVVEGGHPIPGNLIEFPLELVATRRVRRRLAGELATDPAESGMQLSIFEVDPASVATVAEEQVASVAEEAAQWQAPEWRSIELPAVPEEKLQELREPRAAAATVADPAPMSMRLLAAVVNASLVGAALLAAAVVAVWKGSATLPGLRAAEIAGGAGLVLFALLYTLLFYMLGEGTPGMHYAHLRLATFDGRRTSRKDRLVRMAGLLLSVLPLGLGLLWTLFDEEHLCWHDRWSKTYLRRY